MDKPKQTGARMSAETLIARNAKLMREFSIETPEDLKEALGDRYHNQEIRKALMDRLSEKNRILLRDFYYHNCPAGLDRFPACVKVTIDWAQSDVWNPKDRDYIQTTKAEEFFSLADSAWWEDPEMLSGVNAFDADRFSVKCVFGEGSIRQSAGNHPDYHPYGELHDLMQHMFSRLRKTLN